MVNEKHEVVGTLSLGDVVRKAGIEASVVAAALQSICEPAQVTNKELKELKGSLLPLDYRFFAETTVRRNAVSFLMIRSELAQWPSYPLITATGSSFAIFLPIPNRCTTSTTRDTSL